MQDWLRNYFEKNRHRSRGIVSLTLVTTELCKLIALDCIDKIKNCDTVSEALLNDLKTIIPDSDFKDISAELNHDYQLSVDRLYAEKILGRNK